MVVRRNDQLHAIQPRSEAYVSRDVPGRPATTTGCVEMRTAPRRPILQRCFVYPAQASAPQPWQCIAYNISASGVGLALPVRLPEGTLLNIQAWELPRACTLKVRVVHA